MQIIRNSPGPYYAELRPEKIDDARPANAPILSQIQRENGFTNALAVLTFAISELKEWFNVKNNITPDQAAMTAELILDNPNFHDLTLGNIKACFRERMMSEKLYDRLDGNIIIGWLRKFKSDMADRCEGIHEGEELERQRHESSGSAGAITHATYMAMLEARANDGDEESKRILSDYKRRSKILTQEECHKKELDFFRYRQEYLKSKGYYDKETDQPQDEAYGGARHGKR